MDEGLISLKRKLTSFNHILGGDLLKGRPSILPTGRGFNLRKPMIPDDLNDLLSLLAATIFADKRVFAKEIETFVREARKLQISTINKKHLSEAKLLVWFDSNAEAIREKISTPMFEAWLYECLDRLSHIENKTLVTDIMLNIAKADEEFHVSEKALLVLTANYWNIDIHV